jgi:hypothetical protein
VNSSTIEVNMLSAVQLTERISALERKGVRFGRPYKSKPDLGQLVSAESEISVAELIGERFGIWKGITVQPPSPLGTDVDLSIRDQDAVFSVQVKTFEFFTSRIGRRVVEAVQDWDQVLPEEQSGYIARSYRGADIVSEDIRSVQGLQRVARAGALTFEPSDDDLRKMERVILKKARESDDQLRHALGFKVLLYDVRHSHIDSMTVHRTINDLMRPGTPTSQLDAVVMLTYEFQTGAVPVPTRITAPLWVRPGQERSARLFRPPRPCYLVQARPFAMPVARRFDQPGWHNWFLLDQGIIKVDDVPFGRVPGL